MTLLELQDVLGERVKVSTDQSIPIENRKQETDTSQIICAIAKQMINNADIVLRTNKLVADGVLKNSTIEKMIG